MATFQYHYDPLDRLIQTAGVQRFYNQSRMTTEIEGTQRYSVFQQDGRLLAQRRHDSTKDECHLLGTDLQQSVLHVVGADKHHSMAYNAYGHRPAENGVVSLLGFNGERADPVTGHYLLGNGYRAFNPVLMRFNSPDSMSPFGKGGINRYAYCGNDPVNRDDETGHMFNFLKGLRRAASENAVSVQVIAPISPRLEPNFKVDGVNFNNLTESEALGVKITLVQQAVLIEELEYSLQKTTSELHAVSKLAAQPLYQEALRRRTREISRLSTSTDYDTRTGYALKAAYKEMKVNLAGTEEELRVLKAAYDFVYFEFKEFGTAVLTRKNTKIRSAL